MPAHKRTLFEIEQDRAEIAKMYLQGFYQVEIVEMLAAQRTYEITQQQVSYDLQVVKKKWRESSLRDFDQARADDLAEIELVRREAWAEWHKSKDAREKTLSESITTPVTIVPAATGKGKAAQAIQAQSGTVRLRDRAAIEKQEYRGDVRYLLAILKCEERKAALLGLDAPVKSALTDPKGKAIKGGFARVVVAMPPSDARGELPRRKIEIVDGKGQTAESSADSATRASAKEISAEETDVKKKRAGAGANRAQRQRPRSG